MQGCCRFIKISPMRILLLLSASLFLHQLTHASTKDTTIYYNLPDSIKAVQFLAEVKFQNIQIKKSLSAGISVNGIAISFSDVKAKRGIYIRIHDFSRVLSLGINVNKLKYGGAYFDYHWKEDQSYKLMIATAFDSASKLTIFSAYMFFPDENKWKFIASYKLPFYDQYIKVPATFIKTDKKTTGNFIVSEVWCQRQNGSWKNLKEENQPSPVINLMGHIDSVAQRQADIKIINDAIAAGKTDATKYEQGVYYSVMNEGTGRQVLLSDTVTVFYKGYLFSDNSIFDQTKDKPATFPLNRLIKGWQIGVPLCKVGGKIKLVIPSDLAYSIRTRSAKIPPNSILVFEIEVVDAK